MKRWLQGFWKWLKTGPDQVTKPKGVPGSLIRKGTEAQAPKRPPTLARKEVPAGIRRSTAPIHFQLGIDFGTSATKVAYQQLGARVEMVRPLLVGHSLRHYPTYCIPSVAAFEKSGRFLLGAEAETYLANKRWDFGLRFLKLVFAGRYERKFFDPAVNDAFEENLRTAGVVSSGYEIDHIVVAFLAYVMNRARDALHRKFQDSNIDLLFNVCLPIDHVEDNVIRPAFEKVLRVSQAVEGQWRDGWSLNYLLEKSRELYQIGESLPAGEEIKVFLIPESVGAIATYLGSLRVRDGIHAVYDIGAGTTDLSIFNMCNVRKSTAVAYWYAARNLPMGTQRIERILAHNIKSSVSKSAGATGAEIATWMTGLADSSLELKERIRQELCLIWEEARKAWREAYGHLKTQREWERDKVHVFLCGGGARMPFVKEIFCQSWMNEGGQNWGPYPIGVLPEPDEYGTLRSAVPFERMCVAYGLTTPKLEMSEYRLPADCPNHTPDKRLKPRGPTYGSDNPDT